MNDLAPMISKRRYSFKWIDPMHTTHVEVLMPDLTECECYEWGDWGPKYQYMLNRRTPITLVYNGNRSKSLQTSLLVESPVLANTREKLPLYIVIEDKKKDLLFHLFLDERLQLSCADVYRLHDRTKLYHANSGVQRMIHEERPIRPLNGLEEHMSYAK